MHGKKQSLSLIFRTSSFAPTAALVMAIVFALTIVATQGAQGQTYTILHSFTGGQDGRQPDAGLTMDKAGNLYGTTVDGGDGNGTVFKLAHKGSGWVFSPLYTFTGGRDGAFPAAGVIIGPDGSFYGVTTAGGQAGACSATGGNGCGTVFNLRPPAAACKTALCPWTETVLYRFTGGSDGYYPWGNLIFDAAGNIYGTAALGADGYCDCCGCGLVYKLTPSNGGWKQGDVYSFKGGSDGGIPLAGVIFDQAGNLYGTTEQAGNGGCYGGCGTVFQLTPSGSGWTENTLYTFQGGSDGGEPYDSLLFDQSGNLYGTANIGGSGNGGTVFELAPSGGGWTFTLLYGLAGNTYGPYDSLIMEAAGNLYGTTWSGGAYLSGAVFKLTPSGGGWTYTSLHDFCASGYPCSDGVAPHGNVIRDPNGNLYGTTTSGGAYGFGVVFEITP